MTAAAAALSAALLLAVAGPALLGRAGRAGALAPGTMLGLWTLATAAWLLTCAAMVLLLAAEVMGPGLKGFVTACVTLLQAVRANDAATWAAVLAPAAALAAARFAWVTLRRGRDAARWRRDHRRGLTAGARRRTVGGRRVWLVDADRPHAYCVPGTGVVVTSGALDALSSRQMRAVLAHEQAHLRGRHHLLVAWARLLNAAFPGVPLLRAAAREVPVLVEWAADDRAARSVGAASLLHALGAMALPARPAERAPEALGADGACPVERARRLLGPARAGGAGRRALAVAAAAVLLLSPPALTLGAAAVTVATSPPCTCTI
ncbi:M56 family metallopeptidase [Nocardiopsis sp. RSe5-2]|uniref:M56 family metallopeptidase n=1 Tax=Nocardiopsis endophytica TaxID=3018445 RepID=A0ABT4UAP4_9ACTN|nr:M56 family metallopeptidase [Nocardiopsis endophytica]MDA2814037.1 M56 family metallopeptidase [Nocardiopsis endophytica]